jgi:hypothetical protein
MNTEFDLNAAIQRWRENLSQSPQFRAENLDELEAHLRDAIATMQGQRLTDEEVFLVATRRLGGVHVLEPEFAKINAREVWLHRALWMLIGVQVWSVLFGLARVVAEMTAVSALLSHRYLAAGSDRNWAAAIGFLSAVAQVLTFALGLWCCSWLIRRREQSLRSAVLGLLRRPGWLALAGVGTCGAFLLIHFFGYVESFLLARTLRLQQFGFFCVARAWSILVLPIVQTVVVTAITVLLARRVFLKEVAIRVRRCFRFSG